MVGSHDPLLTSINLLQLLTELRKLFTYMYQLIIKGYNSRIARWQMHRTRHGEWAKSFDAMRTPLSVNFPMFTNLEAPIVILLIQVQDHIIFIQLH